MSLGLSKPQPDRFCSQVKSAPLDNVDLATHPARLTPADGSIASPREELDARISGKECKCPSKSVSRQI